MKKADILKIHGESDMREDIKLILDEFVLKMKELLYCMVPMPEAILIFNQMWI